MRLNENGTVRVAGLQPEILLALELLQPIFTKYGVERVITAGTEKYRKNGTRIHMLGSKHDDGLAVDFRSREVPDACWTKFISDCRDALGIEYDFVTESDHFHLEFDPPIEGRYR